MGFEPIAIVGRGCVLPDALNPDAFSENVAARRMSLSTVPQDRWRLPRSWALGTTADGTDRTWTEVGGYVRGFDSVFDAQGFMVHADEILGLDPLFQWVLHGTRQALREAGHDGPAPRAGLVLGNLSFPSAELARFAEQVWLDAQPPTVRDALSPAAGRLRPDARNRFSSGLPAHFAAKALGLGAGAFALDAGCASSLYAIKLACDRLHDEAADLMVAGAVNCADDLFIHMGFCALSAMSSTGQSRPFHRGADGLVPAEGAAFVALMRLADAVSTGAEIFGVIRGIGLSNDGRGTGLLVPAVDGQERAMRLAYQAAGISPDTVSLVECHATGTVVGDTVEATSTARVFGDCVDLPIGSVKSNVGHLTTAAGGAGLLKVLGAIRAGIRPPTLGADEPIEALDGTPLRLLAETEGWQGFRRAAVSAFGFGGNNAHLIVDAWEGDASGAVAPIPPEPSAPLAIVAVGARVSDGRDTEDFLRALLRGERRRDPRETVEVALEGLRFPPRDLEHVHAQQLLVLEAAREAVRGVRLPRDRTMVLVGMGCDPEVARYCARWRAVTWLADSGDAVDPTELARFRDAIHPPLNAAGVVGTMPNILANRLNTQFDLAGPSFSVSAEEASGLVALEIAARAIRAGEADAAVVGAVDLSHEPVHQAALAELGRACPPGDAAVALVLKRVTDARRDGDRVIALLDDRADDPNLVVGEHDVAGEYDPGTARFDPAELFGAAHAAKGLVAVATAALAVHHRAVPRVDAPADPALGEATAEVVVSPLSAPPTRVRVRGGDAGAWLAEPPPRLHVYSGEDRHGALAALAAGRESGQGPARLVVLAADADQLAARSEAARRWLTGMAGKPEGVTFREAPLAGEVAFVFTNGAAAYPGMGRELILAFPSIMDTLEARCGSLRDVAGWAYAGADGGKPHVLEQIWGASLLGQLHTEITRGLLGIEPNAVLGYSSGESSALTAMGAWKDIPALVADARGSELFTRALVGEYEAVRRAWQRAGVHGDQWMSYLVSAPLDDVRAALDGEPAVHLMSINAADVCVVGGEAMGCERVLGRLGSGHALPLDYEIAVHAPELEEVREQWWRLHYRPTYEVPDVRFYSCATGDWYSPTPEAAADAITAQALGTIDFVRTVERAWADGVRVFIEHGPKGLCTGWIERILGDRDHLAVALDRPGGRDVRQLTHAIAELVAAGVPLDANPLLDHLAGIRRAREDSDNHLSLPAHPPAVRLPELKPPAETMRRAPSLPPAPAWTATPVTESAPTAPSSPMPRPATSVTAPTASAPTPVTSRLPVTWAAASTYHRRLSAVHQDFLTLQAEVHQRFLLSRQQAETALLKAFDMPRMLPAARPPETSRASAPSTSAPTASQPELQLTQPIPVPEVPVPRRPLTRSGPVFDRAQLERLASGKISELFGQEFAPQDAYPRQTRMPQPPMLLADRVTGIDAVPASMGTGTIRTETDVRLDSWYLDACGRMPAGVMIEAGQADLLLISWLGVDLLNKGERVYRLLGCDLAFHGSPAVAGETLRYEITIDGHGEHDGVRLFFFHYDCHVGDELRMSIRNGQAGFFTDAELAATDGVLWDPVAEPPEGDGPLDPPALACSARRFGPDPIRAFADGRPADCFGTGWEVTRAHVRSPRIADGRMLLLHEVTEFDPLGGPWGRGYLRAETPIAPQDWFFDGHFKNDPCMPGTLMFEGCLQAMAFYLAAMGFTIDRDGWRFEPVPDEPYRMRCRGQVTPANRLLTYEVFISELSGSPEPTLFADVLCTVDDVKAFHARRVGLRLVPDWPLSHWRQLGPPAVQTTGELVPLPALGGLQGYRAPQSVAVAEGFSYDYASLLATAWGRPTEAFGPSYAPFDGTRRAARLPGPPYHFMTRIVSLDGPPGAMKIGSQVTAEYDVPEEVWYFEQNGYAMMPLSVLVEVVLQPCGWLASYVGSPLTTDTDLLFRNLDGTGTVTGEIRPGTRTLRVHAELRQVSRSAGVIIESFAVECFADGRPVVQLSTVFGYFPRSAFDNQGGLSPSDDERARLTEPCDRAVDLSARPSRYCDGELRLAGPMLLMLDRITGYWPEAGGAGLGRLRAEKDVDPGEWFFKAHFFQDPVQPGSLGVEAMCQLLQFYLIERDFGAGLRRPRFESVMLGNPVTWKYRGQVVPANRRITVEMEILATGEDERGRYAIAEAWLWVDGKRIYHVQNLGVRVVEGGTDDEPPHADEELLDPAVDTWLLDHCPNWTVPALPMMSTVDRIAAAATEHTGRDVVGLRDVTLRRWVPVPRPVRLKTEVRGTGDELAVALLMWREAATAALSRFETVAGGTALIGAPPSERPPVFEPLAESWPMEDPYSSDVLPHGPRFHYLVSLRMGATGSSGVLDAGRGDVPRGLLHQGLLDAVTHVIPHDRLWQWSPEIGADVVGYPHRITRLDLFEPLPDAGEVHVEARFAGFDGDDRLRPAFDLQLCIDDRVLVAMRLVEALIPKGRLGLAEPRARRAFLRDKRYAAGLGLSTSDGEVTRLSAEEVDQFDWLPGTVAHVYNLPPGARGRDHLARITICDHIARIKGVHPSEIGVDDDLGSGCLIAGPLETHHVLVEQADDQVTVRSVTPRG